MKDKTFTALTGIFFLLFAIGIGSLAISQTPILSNMLRAQNSAVSPLKSFGVVYPQIATAGNTNVKVSVYIRAVDGSILANRSVQLTAEPPTLTISPSETITTNEIGQAEFTVTTTTPGKVKLAARETNSDTNIINIPSVEFVE